ncbi:Dlt1p TDEL_0A01860 [Torulaspora delbrueckii]|mgnify:CR=1 FL=1|uniref:Defect at low temperature protein 1 n=1 Tax=Torulaspora delbrueckii TaxID=4950 RepID=G8ZLM4_TORDE|nr:hypothetical protein TDEL_0A01860 [Torulaspora delbrueckii]CCE89518.1 hypothetical protein TDEL_0A01860 [Torulaspora delbrueckii]
MHPIERWKRWFYRGSLVFAMLFLIGFSIVLPIDCIAQAAQSSNNALNTFIVVGALVAFGVACIVIVVGRIIFYKSCRRYIPRRYIPISAADLPHKGSRKLILENMDRSKDLSALFKMPKDPVIHAGLEPPARCDNTKEEKFFPEYLNYQSCIKSLADRMRYQGVFLNNMELDMKLDETFSDVVRNQFMKDTDDEVQLQNAQRFIEIYETVRFSGQEVTRKQFVDFVSLAIYLVDVSMTMDKKKHTRRSSSRLQVHSKLDDDPWEKEVSRDPSEYSTYPNRNVDYERNEESSYADTCSVLRRMNTGASVSRPLYSRRYSGY